MNNQPAVMTCAQCQRETSWASNEFAPNHLVMLCGNCHRDAREYEQERQYRAHLHAQFCAETIAIHTPAERDAEYIAKFNRQYVERLRVFGQQVNEYVLWLVLADTAEALDKRPRVEQALPIPTGDIQCPKCEGTGRFSLKNARTSETGETTSAVCFPCQGKGTMTVADQWRTNTYYAKYYRITG